MVKTQNEFIRNYSAERNVYLWQIADALGKHPTNFSAMLRHELPKEKQDLIIDIIDRIAESQAEE